MEIAETLAQDPEDALSQDLLVAKFRNYAKEQFQDSVPWEIDYLQYIKRGAQLLSFRLNDDKGELFVYQEAVPFYLLCDTPAVLKLDEWIKNDCKGKFSAAENYKAIKDFYTKWAVLKSEQEKKYYALSTIKLIERDTNANNILKFILHAVILTYDKKLFSPDKALEQLQNAKSVFNQIKIGEPVRNGILYLINLFSAFVYMKKCAYLEANEALNEALKVMPSGLSARFYLALTDKRIGDRQNSVLVLNDLIGFDKEAIKYTIEQNNINLFSYFIQFAVTYNIFRENDFADLLEEIQAVITASQGIEPLNYEQLGSWILKLNELYLQEYYTEEVSRNIEFLDRINRVFTGNRNSVAAFSQPFLKDKTGRIIELIITSIKQKYTDELTARLRQYDAGIEDNMEAIKHLTKDAEEIKKNHQKKLEEALQEFDNRVSDTVAAIELRIENIHQIKKYDPRSSFNSSMVYNVMVTLLVFIIGGFVGCYSSAVGDSNDFKDVMSVVVVAGMKWASLTFLIGIIVSMFSAAFTYIEKMNEKQSLLKKITYLKAYKEKEAETIKKEHEKKLKTLAENIAERIEEHKRSAESLKVEKEAQRMILQTDVDDKVKQFSDKLQAVSL